MKDVDINVEAILTREQLINLCSSFWDLDQKVKFDIEDVPTDLHSLAHYAEVWGVADDWAREDLVHKTPEIIKKNLKWAVTQLEDQLDYWLGGAEAMNEEPTDAYVAFSALRMASDLIWF